MYPSYELLCHVPTQSLFNNKISMMRKCSTFSENGYGPATPLRLTEYGFCRGQEAYKKNRKKSGDLFFFFFLETVKYLWGRQKMSRGHQMATLRHWQYDRIFLYILLIKYLIDHYRIICIIN